MSNCWDAFERTHISQGQGVVCREGANGMSCVPQKGRPDYWVVPSLLPSPNQSWISSNPSGNKRINQDKSRAFCSGTWHSFSRHFKRWNRKFSCSLRLVEQDNSAFYPSRMKLSVFALSPVGLVRFSTARAACWFWSLKKENRPGPVYSHFAELGILNPPVPSWGPAGPFPECPKEKI